MTGTQATQGPAYGAPVLNLYFSAHAYPAGYANICQCLLWGAAIQQPISKLP